GNVTGVQTCALPIWRWRRNPRLLGSILKTFKIEPLEDVASSATSGDLESIMDNSRESGDLDDDTYLVLDRLLHFPHEDVDHAMVDRKSVVWGQTVA